MLNIIIMNGSSKKDQLGFEFLSSRDDERCSNDQIKVITVIIIIIIIIIIINFV